MPSVGSPPSVLSISVPTQGQIRYVHSPPPGRWSDWKDIIILQTNFIFWFRLTEKVFFVWSCWCCNLVFLQGLKQIFWSDLHRSKTSSYPPPVWKKRISFGLYAAVWFWIKLQLLWEVSFFFSCWVFDAVRAGVWYRYKDLSTVSLASVREDFPRFCTLLCNFQMKFKFLRRTALHFSSLAHWHLNEQIKWGVCSRHWSPDPWGNAYCKVCQAPEKMILRSYKKLRYAPASESWKNTNC